MYCEKCGAQLGSCALFCNNCGAGVTQNVENEEKNTDIAVETVAISVAPKSNTAKNVMLIVRNSLIMLLAAVMLAFSFLPVISVGTDYSGVDVKMHLSPIDSIRITIDSFFEYSSPDESHVYGYISELSEELSDEIGTTVKDKEILKKYENEISRFAVLTLRLQLSLEGMRAPISFYCAAILSLLYMLLTVVFFVFSIFNLLSTFSIIRMGKRSLGWFNSIFAATPVFMIALFFVMGVSYSAAVTVSLTGWAIAALIIAVITVIYSIVQRFIFAESKNIRVFVMRSVVAVLALAVMISALVPVCYTSYSGDNVTGTDIKMNIGAFNKYSSFSDEQLDFDVYQTKEQKAAVKTLFDSLASLTKSERRGVAGQIICNEIAALIVLYTYVSAVRNVFAAVSIAYIVSVAVAALVMWHCIKYLIDGKENKIAYLIYRIVLVCAAATALGFVIASVVMIDDASGYYFRFGYSFIIGASSILMTAFSAVIISMPTFKNKDNPLGENEYGYLTVQKTEPSCEAEEPVIEEEKCENSVADDFFSQIKQLKELYDMGAITDEEFSAKKAMILGIK